MIETLRADGDISAINVEPYVYRCIRGKKSRKTYDKMEGERVPLGGK